ncbi:MAG: hypothetical protein JWM14_1196 [Chitinophagaceae bacterium]|nr:hypothetical protein [Chitinophagaceae bacterium]
MGNRFLLVALSFLLYWNAGAQSSSAKVDRKAFYAALSNGDMNKLNDQLKKMESLSFEEKNAFTGVLKMRKAEFAKGLKTKLDLFKSGGAQLEDEIAKHKANAEYRFLRLIMQENAPAILNYNDNIEEDAKIVKASYAKLPQETKAAILDYCKKSKALKVQDFN